MSLGGSISFYNNLMFMQELTLISKLPFYNANLYFRRPPKYGLGSVPLPLPQDQIIEEFTIH